MISDINTNTPTDVTDTDTLDTNLTEFKSNVKESFPNVDAEVSCTGAQLNQLIDNNFDSTIIENGTEVVKLSGATFTGEVINPDGNNPQFFNQLVTKAYVDFAINVVWPPLAAGFQQFILDAVVPDLYWPLQESGPPTAEDVSPNTYDGTYGGIPTYESPSVVPSELDRNSVWFGLPNDGLTGNFVERLAPLPTENYVNAFAMFISLKPTDVGSNNGILQLTDGGFPNPSFSFLINVSGDSDFRLYIQKDISTSYFINSAAIDFTKDYLIGMVYNDVTKEVKFYVCNDLGIEIIPQATVGLIVPTAKIIIGDQAINSLDPHYMSDFFMVNSLMSDAGVSILYDKWLNG